MQFFDFLPIVVCINICFLFDFQQPLDTFTVAHPRNTIPNDYTQSLFRFLLFLLYFRMWKMLISTEINKTKSIWLYHARITISTLAFKSTRISNKKILRKICVSRVKIVKYLNARRNSRGRCHRKRETLFFISAL